VTGSVGVANRVRIPRRLATLAAGAAILPLGAVVAVSVAASPSAAAAQTHASATGSLLRFHLLPLSLPLAVGPAAPSPPYVMVIPPAPKIAPFEEIAGTEVPGNTYTAAQVETIITAAAEADGVDPAWMIATATCESNLHPNSYNPSGPYYGLFQFLMSTFRAHGGTSIWDPVQQAQIAASMFASGDSSAWPICSLR